MKQEVLKQLKNYNKLVIGISGGVDSMVLLDIIKNHKDIVVCHINHNVREESKFEYKRLKEITNDFNIPFEYLSLNLENKENFHNESRLKRYDFFNEILNKYKAEAILSAHHADDDIETILMNLNKGSYIDGFSGIKNTKYKNSLVLRPLINISKEQIYNYAKINNIEYFEDKSNKSEKYTRNRYRLNIIPMLKEENNTIKHFKEFKHILMDINDTLDKLVKPYIKKNKILLKDFYKLDKSLKRHALFKIVKNNLNHNVVNNIISNIKNDKEYKEYVIKDGFLIKSNGYISFEKQINRPKPFNIYIDKPGTYDLGNKNKLIVSLLKVDKVCYNNIRLPIIVRNREATDKIIFEYGTKTIKKLFIDNKIDKTKREKIPIILDNKNNILSALTIKNSAIKYVGDYYLTYVEEQNE